MSEASLMTVGQCINQYIHQTHSISFYLAILFSSILGLQGIMPLGSGPQWGPPYQGMVSNCSIVRYYHNFYGIFTPAHLVCRTNCRLNGLWPCHWPFPSHGSFVLLQEMPGECSVSNIERSLSYGHPYRFLSFYCSKFLDHLRDVLRSQWSLPIHSNYSRN